MTLQVESSTVYTSQGVPISVTGIAQVNKNGALRQNEIIIIILLELNIHKI
jgi:flotillin